LDQHKPDDGFFFYLLSSGGVNNTAFVWYYVFPLFSLFLLGPQKGILANLIFLIPSVCFLLFEPRILFFTTYSTDLKLRFIPSYYNLHALATGGSHGRDCKLQLRGSM
jgi:hypothetical protein